MTRAGRSNTWWCAAALLLVVIVAIAMRLASGADSSGPRFDEQWIVTPIVDLVVEGWSVETAVDFEETKGPGLIWPYALWGSAVGITPDAPLGRLRLFSMLWFVAGALPLLVLARGAGVRGAALVGVTLLYALLPQNAVLGQLLMSESIFIAGSLAMLAIFVWSFDGPSSRRDDGRLLGRPLQQEDWIRRRRILGPILVAILLSWLLHTRIHAVAFAGAICIVAALRDGRRSWPWWLACALAGLSRIPLAVRWGGLVSPMYREMHQLGGADERIVLANVTYLLAAIVPLTALFLVRRWGVASRASDGVVGGIADRRWMPIAGGVIGLILGVVASPALASKLPAPPLWVERAPDGIPRYLGAAASMVRDVSGVDPAVRGSSGTTGVAESTADRGGQTGAAESRRPPRSSKGSLAVAVGLYALLSTVGGASLGALAAIGWRRGRADGHGRGESHGRASWSTVSPRISRTLVQLTVLTLCGGVLLYATTRSFVLDRYLLPWACLLPILWLQHLDRRLLIVQIALLVVMLLWGVRAWLV